MSRPLTNQEIDQINNGTYDDSAADLSVPEQRTELANARRFIDLHGQNLRYCYPWRKWTCWIGTHWVVDDGAIVERLAGDVVSQVWDGVEESIRRVERSEGIAMLSFAKATASASGIEHFLELARSQPGIAIKPSDFDSNPWLLNCENGTVDLKTGKRRAHDKRDLITKLAPVIHTEHHTSELWERSISTWMGGDAELIGFLKRLCGLWLTGVTTEHVLPILYGSGANGKSVFLGAMESLLGTDYCVHAPQDLLLVKKGQSHPTERADLFGKRLVVCQETEGGSRLAESLVKELTGGDRIRARRMREDFWEFSPSHKLAISSNYRPVVRGTDHGIWRRLRLIPFAVTIPQEQQDKDLPGKLKRQLSGILKWCIDGCVEWQRIGLAEPASVLAATDAYRTESDTMGQFIDSCCLVEQNVQVSGGRLYTAYVDWCKANGHDADNNTVFGRKLTERGFDVRKTEFGRVRQGIMLLSVPNDSADGF